MEFSVRCPSPSNTYSYVYEENLGSTRKFVQNFLFVYVYFQPNSCNTHAKHEWVQGTLLRQRRKVPPAHMQRVFYHGGKKKKPRPQKLQYQHNGPRKDGTPFPLGPLFWNGSTPPTLTLQLLASKKEINSFCNAAT